MIPADSKFVDAHCHIDLYKSESPILAQIEENKIWTLAVTNLPKVFFHTKNLSLKSIYVQPAVGFHPELAAQFENDMETIDVLIKDNQFVGEIGLDFVTNDASARTKQQRVFSHILSVCSTYPNRVLSVHSRRATNVVLQHIPFNFPGAVILHWFSGSPRELDDAVKLGCYFSLNPAMLLSNAGRKVASLVPKNRVLTESDGPFVLVEGEPAGPKMMPKLVEMIAELWNEPFETVRAQIVNNLTSCLAPNSETSEPPI